MDIFSERKQRVALVVDNDHLVLDVTAALLEDLGFKVYPELDGRRALDRLRRDHSIELLLTDFRMYGMSGLQLIHQAREERPELLSILAAAHPDDLPSEDIAVLLKPYSRRDLVRALSFALHIRERLKKGPGP